MGTQMQENSGKKKRQLSPTEGRAKASASSARKRAPVLSLANKQSSNLTDVSVHPVAQEMRDREHTRIAQLAYELYEQCGREDDHDLEHWLEAERQILASYFELAAGSNVR